ncbi:MAG: gfo/Idh/MocA family oxidoreductase, partial [Candidatus Dormiibacterota bacterium]
GCAPDTLLGSGFQASRKRFAEGAIGRPLGAQGFMFRRLPPTPASATGAFAFFDMAPYYVTALVNLLGPARRVTGSAQTLTAEQAAGGGDSAVISFAGVIEFANRVLANVLLVWGTSHRSEVPFVKVFGTTGVLDVPNPNVFGDPGFVRPYDAAPDEEIAASRQPAEWPRNLRGLGVAELAAALREGRQPRAGADVACHVVEVIASIVSAAEDGRHVDLTTTCSPPPPLSLAEEAALLGL